ncbi:unnamed protein product [Symbiodinium sp. CCMP2592]|nr:unnamed protein product [Symbiodinium sp. CCMP2592]
MQRGSGVEEPGGGWAGLLTRLKSFSQARPLHGLAFIECFLQLTRPSAPGSVALALHLVAAEAGLSPDGTVHDLGGGNFSSAITRSGGLSFVEFYAPWCGHCKKLVPEWERTAELCKDDGILVAKVDSIAEKALAQQHEVQSFPTLRLFRGSPKVSVKYEGPRTAAKMAEWVKVKQNEDLVQRLPASSEEIAAWASQKPVAVLGLLEGVVESSVLLQVLEDASFALNPSAAGGFVPIGLVESTSSALLETLGLGSTASGPRPTLPCVALLRSFDFEEKVLVFTPQGSWPNSFEALMSWIAAKRVPALIPGSEQTEKFFLQDIDPGNGLVLYFGEDEQLRRDLHELAVSFRSDTKLKWVHLKKSQFGESLGKNVGLTPADFPEVAIWEFGETEDADKVYRLSQQSSGAALTRKAVQAFVDDWRQGKLSAEKDPVVSVTSDTFDSLVIDNDKDVLVEFYAPWCGHCKALAPEYKLVAQHYEQDDGISIVKMDATKYKHSSADIKSYPTLKLYAKGKKDTPIDGEFKSTRTKDGIMAFIEEHRATKKKGGKGAKQKDTDNEPKQSGAPVPATQVPLPADDSFVEHTEYCSWLRGRLPNWQSWKELEDHEETVDKGIQTTMFGQCFDAGSLAGLLIAVYAASVAAGVVLYYGRPELLDGEMDSHGQICGIGNVHRPMLYWPAPGEARLATCVDECPAEVDVVNSRSVSVANMEPVTIQWLLENGTNLTQEKVALEKRQMLGRNSYPVYETLPCLGRFCLPDVKAPGIFASLLWAAGEQGAVVPGASVLMVYARRLLGILRQGPPWKEWLVSHSWTLSGFVCAAAVSVFALGGLSQAVQAACPRCAAFGTTTITGTLAAGAGKMVWDTLRKVDTAAASDAAIGLEQGSLAPGGLLLVSAALVALAALAAIAVTCTRKRLTRGAAAISASLLAVPRRLLQELLMATLLLAVTQVASLFACAALVQRAASVVVPDSRISGVAGSSEPWPLPAENASVLLGSDLLGEAWPPGPVISDAQPFAFSDGVCFSLLLVVILICCWWLQLTEAVFRGKVALTVAFWYFSLDPEDVAQPLASPPAIAWVLTRRHVGSLAKRACFSSACLASLGSLLYSPWRAEEALEALEARGCERCWTSWASWAEACSGQPAVFLSVFPGNDFLESVSIIAASVPFALETLRGSLGASSLPCFFSGASIPLLVVAVVMLVSQLWQEPEDGEHRSTEDTIDVMWLLILLIAVLPAGMAWSTFSGALTESLLTCCMLDDAWFQAFRKLPVEPARAWRHEHVPESPVTVASSHVLWSSRMVPLRLRILLTESATDI